MTLHAETWQGPITSGTLYLINNVEDIVVFRGLKLFIFEVNFCMKCRLKLRSQSFSSHKQYKLYIVQFSWWYNFVKISEYENKISEFETNESWVLKTTFVKSSLRHIKRLTYWSSKAFLWYFPLIFLTLGCKD